MSCEPRLSGHLQKLGDQFDGCRGIEVCVHVLHICILMCMYSAVADSEGGGGGGGGDHIHYNYHYIRVQLSLNNTNVW